MPIAYDASSGGQTTATSLTISHTCTGSDLVLMVYVYWSNGGGTTDDITGVTYNGTSLTKLITQDFSSSDASFHYIFALLNPSTGANDIVVSSSNSGIIGERSSSFTGVDTGQTLPDASNSNTVTTATSVSTSVTTVADNSWIFAGGYAGGGGVSAGTNLTIRNSSPDSNYASFDTNSAITPAGSTTIQVTKPSSGKLVIVGASFAPFVQSGPAKLKTWNTIATATVKTEDTVAIASIKTADTVA